MFEYMTAQEAAEKWNATLRWVQRLCKENRIEGVIIAIFTNRAQYFNFPGKVV